MRVCLCVCIGVVVAAAATALGCTPFSVSDRQKVSVCESAVCQHNTAKNAYVRTQHHKTIYIPNMGKERLSLMHARAANAAWHSGQCSETNEFKTKSQHRNNNTKTSLASDIE